MPRRARTPLPAPPGFVWVDEAVRLTGLSKHTLYKYHQRGTGPECVPIGRKLAYPLTGIAAYLESLRSCNAEPNRDSRPAEPSLPRQRSAA